MSPSATPAAHSEGRCRQGPRLRRRMHVDVVKGHACQANSRDEQRTQARHQSQPCAISATPATQSAAWCRQATPQLAVAKGLPRKVKVDVAKCHACHANSRGDQRTQARHQSQPSAKSATPARQSEGRCHQAPRLLRKMKADVAKCHARHADQKTQAPPEPAQCH